VTCLRPTAQKADAETASKHKRSHQSQPIMKKTFTKARIGFVVAIAIVTGMLCCKSVANAEGVTIRLSCKFILNSDGHRAATGTLNTDEEIAAQLVKANAIFADANSELRFETLEIVNIASVAQWFPSEATVENRDDLRTTAQANPALYRWRDDAINIYITGAPGIVSGGRADFPPNNNIIMLPANTWDTTLAHEIGHCLGLPHTHEPNGGDRCADTIADNENWTINDIAENNFGTNYANLNSSQRTAVDLVWNNVMSYHDEGTLDRLSPCQMDRSSAQACDDRLWLLSREPVYVNNTYNGLTQNGSFERPYNTIQRAINDGQLSGKVVVLQSGSYSRPSSVLNFPLEVISRSGAATVQCRPVPYAMPAPLEESTNRAVQIAIIKAQEKDMQKDIAGVIAHLQEAEKHATGRERDAIQLELAQRFRDSARFEEAAVWFKKVSEGADQAKLEEHARHKEEAMRKQAQSKRKQREATK
jgi:hypothetical protein